MEQNDYISFKMKEFAMNISEFIIGQTIKDSDGAQCKIVDKSINSIEVHIKKKNKKHGIDCNQWFDMNNFNKRFKA